MVRQLRLVWPVFQLPYRPDQPSRTVAITPFRLGQFDFDEVRRVCQTCTIAGFKAMYESGTQKPFRFIYFSAEGTPTDPAKKPAIWGDYQIMRVS